MSNGRLTVCSGMSSTWASGRTRGPSRRAEPDLMPASLNPGKGDPRSGGHYAPAAINGDGLTAQAGLAILRRPFALHDRAHRQWLVRLHRSSEHLSSRQKLDKDR
jgi:hypothetical protein